MEGFFYVRDTQIVPFPVSFASEARAWQTSSVVTAGVKEAPSDGPSRHGLLWGPVQNGPFPHLN